MNFKKIKITKTGGLELAYTRLKTDSEGTVLSTEVVEKSKDEVHPDFANALQAFQDIVRKDEGYTAKHQITITGVSLFSQHETVIITHTKEIKSGVTARNSGRINIAESESGLDLIALGKMVENLVKEATAYIVDNKRAQLSIFSPEVVEDGEPVMEAV